MVRIAFSKSRCHYPKAVKHTEALYANKDIEGTLDKWEKQILIEEAKARKESAVLEAEAEVERAKGVAEANRIIANGLSGQDEYLRYLWINQLTQNENQVIYVPTETGLPLLEAGQR